MHGRFGAWPNVTATSSLTPHAQNVTRLSTRTLKHAHWRWHGCCNDFCGLFPRGSYVSRRGTVSKLGGAMLRVTIAAGALVSSGCAYFHPAFVTNASPLSAAATSGERGVLVCERRSITRQQCGVMSHSEVHRLVAELARHY